MICTVFWLVCALTAVASVHAGNWPDFHAPPELRLESVGDEMTVNGLPARIARFDSNLKSDTVLDFYREEWGADNGRFVENGISGWRVIGRRDGAYYQTVQTRDTPRGSTGFLALSEYGKKQPALNAEFPRPAGTDLISVVESRDPGKSATTLVMRNRRSIAGNALYYRNTLRAQGWRELTMQSSRQGGGRVEVMRLDRPNEAAQIVVQSGQPAGSLIVVNVETTEARIRE